MASLFTSQTPVSTNNDDGAPGITTATSMVFAVDGTVAGIRFYATATVSGTYTAALWRVTAADDAPGGGAGTLLASKVMGGAPTGGTWNTVLFDTPVSVTAGLLYRAGLHSSAGRYVSTISFFVGPLVNGDITAPADGSDPVLLGSLAQGVFEVNATPTFPDSGFGSSSYFIDVDFSPTGEEPTGVTADGIVVPVALGAPTLSFPGATADGISVGLSVGEPTAGLVGAEPIGIAMAAEVGAPDVSDGPPGPEPEPVTPVAQGSWYGLLDTRKLNAEFRREEASNPPVACPNDGEPLLAGPRGGLYCPYDGWRPGGRYV